MLFICFCPSAVININDLIIIILWTKEPLKAQSLRLMEILIQGEKTGPSPRSACPGLGLRWGLPRAGTLHLCCELRGQKGPVVRISGSGSGSTTLGCVTLRRSVTLLSLSFLLLAACFGGCSEGERGQYCVLEAWLRAQGWRGPGGCGSACGR